MPSQVSFTVDFDKAIADFWRSHSSWHQKSSKFTHLTSYYIEMKNTS
ncbi:MAG: hypothetical protein RMY36_020815 [Nostoc sp. SerVER01]|nr:hypothetical protein [Nostoc sp. SerVER01]